MINYFLFFYIITILILTKFNLNFDEFLIIFLILILILIYNIKPLIFKNIYKFYKFDYYYKIIKFVFTHN